MDENKDETTMPQAGVNTKALNIARLRAHVNAQTILPAQILYMITLRWIFYSKRNEAILIGELESVKDGSVSQENERSEQDDYIETRWYFYPFSGDDRMGLIVCLVMKDIGIFCQF